MEQSIQISKEYITLGQLLKEVGLIDTGGQAKWFLDEYKVFLNGEQEQRRGKKLYSGDRIEIETGDSFLIAGK
ncbi:S4 domain-containing protein YaaA [Alkalihalobacillus sp. LMS39]|uniref:S4 domain-containing protein YaaA n=1 Tax=Alkalihalobacillus sp. LMS39 TaxID=2924032 RepID=UPI001FB52BC4|nr:S4 domain-containing protein YaaA [Alkalihalobacillus sp. LMS39]UOE94145.1 S4 domain-containing protein YaaA [Alkalihalobacillus sp. LMS39]